MKNIVSILFLILLLGCSLKSDKEEIKNFVFESSGLILPDDFKVITNELHGEYQTSDSDFSKFVFIKFSRESIRKMIKELSYIDTKGSWIKNGDSFIFEGSNNGHGFVHMSLDTISGDFYIEYFE